MREAYHRELAQFRGALADLAQLAGIAMTRATSALLDDDLAIAGRVVADEETLDTLHELLDQRALAMLACQQPVAGDLRTIVAGLRMSADLQRMGKLASHVAEMVQRRHPRPVVPAWLRPTVSAMGAVAARLAAGAREAMVTGNAEAASRMDTDDDEMDHLQTFLYQLLLDNDGRQGIETTMDLTLLGRYYERFADHAVSLAKRVAFAAGSQGKIGRIDRTLLDSTGDRSPEMLGDHRSPG